MSKKKVKINSNFMEVLTIILIVIATIMMFIKIFIQPKKYDELVNSKYDYEVELKKAESAINADKEKWNIINSNNYVNANSSSEDIRYNYTNIQNIRNGINEEFLEAIEWAENKNAEYQAQIVSPFDKEGYIDTYYTTANEINSNLKKQEKKLEKIELNRSSLILAIILLVAEMIIIYFQKNFENKTTITKKSAICMILGILSIILSI